MEAKASESALEQSWHHIAEAEERVAEQKVRLANLKEHGHTDLARAAEKNLQVTMEILTIAREYLRLEKEMARHPEMASLEPDPESPLAPGHRREDVARRSALPTTPPLPCSERSEP
jgi:hypothetical protein